MDEPFVKVFVEEREMTVMLVVDLSASEQWGTIRAPKAQVAAEVSALCAFSAIKNNDNVGLVISTDDRAAPEYLDVIDKVVQQLGDRPPGWRDDSGQVRLAEPANTRQHV